MIGDKDLAIDGECSRTKTSKPRFSHLNTDKTCPSQKGVDFLNARSSKSSPRSGNELTLSYLCESRDLSGQKGKEELVVVENLTHDGEWIERDFFSLRESGPNPSKRKARDDEEEEETKTLNLSLSLTASNAVSKTKANSERTTTSFTNEFAATVDAVKRTRANGEQTTTSFSNEFAATVEAVKKSRANGEQTITSFSNDFAAKVDAVKKSRANSERATTSFSDDFAATDDAVKKARSNGERATTSFSNELTATVDAVKRSRANSERTTTSFSNDFTAMSNSFSHNISCSMTRNSTDFDCSDHIWNAGEGTNGSVHSRFRPISDGVNTILPKPSASSDYSFFPSDLPAAISGDRNKLQNPEEHDDARSDKVLYDVVSQPISSVALMIQGMAEETLESAKEHLRNLIDSPEHKEKLTSLQHKIDERSDLCKETLSKCVKDQLDILVTIRTGLKYFLSGKIRIPMNELVEIFLFLRCRNVNCKSLLPVDDCECKICLKNKGFCSSCMCPVCLRFDSASNTCSWVGCDVCSHWCHAACGIQRGLIKPGYSAKGRSEMLFHCVGCGHKSEMFGFVKDVFVCCAKNWGDETLIKELECVAKVFRGSGDGKGRALYLKANEMVKKLESKEISPPDASNFIIQFFNYAESLSEFPDPKEQTVTSVTHSTSKDQKKQSFALTDAMMNSFDSLESMVRIKEAETRMFQKKADEARIEAESFKRMI